MAAFFRRLFGVKRGHRGFDGREAQFLRRVAPKAGAPAERVTANPGVRVEPDFVCASFAAALAEEVRGVVNDYGVEHNLDDETRTFYEKQQAHLGQNAPRINMRRVTGRSESAAQRLAPWLYGDAFDAQRLPPRLAELGAKIAASDSFALGALRDVTINARRHSFFRLDGHLDPPDDGGNVFILGLLSDTVLTVSPVGPPFSTLQDPRIVSLQSWAPGEDVDVLAQQRALVHLSGAARSKLHHGIRLGVTRDQLASYGVAVRDDADDAAPLYDWFGDLQSPVSRHHERLSVVFAFADQR
ncbi:hypothetical protein M885DRAFT_513028 [Pelagophyceae sp. CCMP2097]|nr:hypothetical protein M885DRAFT_513028 [Pelagophyceae sp. CCMP2097]